MRHIVYTARELLRLRHKPPQKDISNKLVSKVLEDRELVHHCLLSSKRVTPATLTRCIDVLRSSLTAPTRIASIEAGVILSLIGHRLLLRQILQPRNRKAFRSSTTLLFPLPMFGSLLVAESCLTLEGLTLQQLNGAASEARSMDRVRLVT
ncbi:hypothetical protein LB505_007392 [Fusarium chuoi]|nr:hypothetical protein LB505_007392 [Fusarium chuoi]